MDILFNEIWRAVGYLLIAGIVYLAWQLAHDSAREFGYKHALWKAFLWCAGIALFATISLGNQTCLEYEEDVRGGTCYEYADDGYAPTPTERLANFTFYLIVLYIPAVLGARKGGDLHKPSNDN